MTKSNVKLPKSFDVTVTDAMIEKSIADAVSKVTTANNAIQKALTTVMLRWNQSGDVGTACRFMNAIVSGLDGTAVRNNAVKAWIEFHCGFTWVKGDDGNSLFTYNKKLTKISYEDVVVAHQSTWSTFTVEKDYVPFNLNDKIQQLINSANKKVEKGNDADDIDMDSLKALQAILR